MKRTVVGRLSPSVFGRWYTVKFVGWVAGLSVLVAALGTRLGAGGWVFGVGLVMLVGYVLGRGTTARRHRLAQQVRRLATGRYDGEIPLGQGTAGELYESFEEVATAMQDRERSLQAERDRMAALFENTSDCIASVELTDEPIVRDVNPQFEDRFGYERDEIRGESLVDLIVPAGRENEREELLRQAKRGETFERELHRETPDGVGIFRFQYVPITTSNSHADQAEGYAVYTDITEQREREEALRERETQYRRLTERVSEAFFAVDREYHITFWNRAIQQRVGRSSEEVLGRNILELFPELRGTKYQEKFDEAMETGTEVSFEFYFDRWDHWAYLRLYPDADGISVYSEEITERKEREQELERYEAAIQSIDDGVFTLDEDYCYTTVNDGLVELTGYSREELLGEPARTIFDEDSTRLARRIRREMDAETQQVRSVELTVVRRDGECVPCETRISPLGDGESEATGTAGTCRDISDRKAMREALRERTRRFEMLISNLQGMVYRRHNEEDWPMTFVSEGAESLTGYEPSAVESGRVSYADIVHPDDREEVWETVQRAIDAEEQFRVEYRIQAKDGETRWVLEQGLAVDTTPDGTAVIEGFITDITERKAHEQELKVTKDRLETVISNAPLILFTMNEEGEFTMAKGKGLEAVGREPGEDVGDSVYERFSDDIIADVERALDGEEVHEVREVGDVVFQNNYKPIFDEDGTVSEFIGVSVDITERKRYEEELERQRYLLQQSQELANVGGWELDLQREPPYEVVPTEELRRICEIPPGESFDMEQGIECYHPDDRPRIRRAINRAIAEGEPYDIESRLVTAKGNERWVRTTSEVVTEDGEVSKLRGALQDITERKQYELALESLHEGTRELLHTESRSDICEVVIDITEEIIDEPGVGIHLLDGDGNQFTPAAATPRFTELCGGTPLLRMGDERSPAWRAFVSGEVQTIDDSGSLPWDGEHRDEAIATSTRVSQSEHTVEADASIQSGLFVPVGDHGIVTLVSTADAIDDRTRQLAETLVATTEAAFDRLESEAGLRERDEQLQSQNERLKRQMRITEILRTVDQSLIDADSREEIQTAVCERLVESDVISFAWIGERDASVSTIVPQTWAGEGQRYLDQVALTSADGEPAWSTAETESVTVIESVAERLHSEPWRRAALEHDFQSVVSVPIRHDEYTYGVLTAYAPDPNVFGDLEGSVFDELAETIGNTINAVQTKQALYADTATELTLAVSGEESFLLQIATETAGRIEFEGLSAATGGTMRVFFTATGTTPDDVESVLEHLVSVTDYRLISATDDGGHFEVTASSEEVASTLVSHGVTPRSMVAHDGQMDVVVDVPRKMDVREFVELLEERFRSVDLLARRDVERSIGTKADFVDVLFESMTDRQHETLATAYYSGFFEWPRETTGEEVATMLGVSQPTVNRHLRLAERSLLDELFEARPHPPTATA